MRLEDVGSLDLHHVSYDGVTKDDRGQWVASEADDDLMPLCRTHHNKLHQIIDEHGRDYQGWNRRRASVVILGRLRREHLRKKDQK